MAKPTGLWIENFGEGNVASTRGNALMAIASMATDHFDRADAILNFYSQEYTSQVQHGKFQGFAEGYDALTGQMRLKGLGTDDQALVGMAAATFVHRTQGLEKYSTSRQNYTKMAEGIGQMLLTKQAVDFKGLLAIGETMSFEEGNELNPKHDAKGLYVTQAETGYRTQDNLYALAFFTMMPGLSGVADQAKYTEGRQKILKALPQFYSKEDKYFFKGIDVNGAVDKAFATTVQAEAIQVLGPATLKSMGINPEDMMETVKTKALVEVNYIQPVSRSEPATCKVNGCVGIPPSCAVMSRFLSKNSCSQRTRISGTRNPPHFWLNFRDKRAPSVVCKLSSRLPR